MHYQYDELKDPYKTPKKPQNKIEETSESQKNSY